MMNLLGCTKENFFKLIDLMNYKRIKRNIIIIFLKTITQRPLITNKNKTNPFSKLLALNIK